MFESMYPPVSHGAFQAASSDEGVKKMPQKPRGKGESGFYILQTGAEALKSRIALIRASQKRIELQYYMVQDDLSGKILMEELLQAADRGVNVRVLLDHLDFSRSKEAARMLGFHDNVEFRVFNPAITKHRPFPFSWQKLREMVQRYSRRMHNKLLLVDGVVGMVGGRNLGDAYFGVDVDFAFSDIDALIMGPVVEEMEKSFEEFWASHPAHVLTDVKVYPPTMEEATAYRIALRTFYELAESYGFFQSEKGEEFLSSLQSGAFPFHWGKALFAADRPEKVLQKDTETVDSPPIFLLNDLLDTAKKEFIAVSPYVVPMDEGMKSLASLRQRGVKVRLLTNSFSATDVPVVHAAYSRYREGLLKEGVELFELKRIPGKKSRSNFLRGRLSSRSSLHAKVYIIDRKWVVFGSMNLDPRSWLMNTENVAAIESPSLAQEMVELFETTIHPNASYHVKLEKGRVVFKSEEKGRIRTYYRDPKAGPIRRMFTWVLARILPEHHL